MFLFSGLDSPRSLRKLINPTAKGSVQMPSSWCDWHMAMLYISYFSILAIVRRELADYATLCTPQELDWASTVAICFSSGQVIVFIRLFRTDSSASLAVVFPCV